MATTPAVITRPSSISSVLLSHRCLPPVGCCSSSTARSGWDRGWKHATLAAAAVGLAVAMVELVQPPDTNTPDPAQAAGPCPVLADARPVEAIADLKAVGLAFPKVSVELTDDGRGRLYRRFAGAIAGTLPPNTHLYLGWADPSSRDSTKERKSGQRPGPAGRGG